VQLDFRFENVTEEERGVFYEMLASDGDRSELHLELHVEYTLQDRLGTRRPILDFWGGSAKGTRIPPQVLERLYHVHFDALRDASWDLRPNRGNRLGQLLEKIEPDRDKQEAYASRLNRMVEEDHEWQRLVRRARSSVNEHLLRTTLAGDPMRVDMEFVSRDFSVFAESLRMVIPVFDPIQKEALPKECTPDVIGKYFVCETADRLRFKCDFLDELDHEQNEELHELLLELCRQTARRFDVGQNGLGCNNLIYFATVLGDIGRRKAAEKETYLALLVEEPEAHLHPQRQSVLFNYFKKWESEGIQSFITSHSPTITAKSDPDTVIVLSSHTGRVTAAAIRDTSLDAEDKSHLQKFLDVTRSQLFFARGVILVEGISEALLMPVFARLVKPVFDLEHSGVEVVIVGGLAFKPFANLFRQQGAAVSVGGRCAIVTDDDRDKETTQHARNAQELKQTGMVEVFLAECNLEYELYLWNEELVRSLYYQPTGLHPRTPPPNDDSIDKRALSFSRKARENDDKGDFALRLAARLSEDGCAAARFAVPDYLRRAVTWVITGSDGPV